MQDETVVVIKKEEALKAFKLAKSLKNVDTSIILQELMPGVLGSVKERVSSYEDACSELGIDPASIILTSDTPDEAAYKKLKVIVKALNEGWEPNWDNSNEVKYYPWFYRSSSRGFSLDGVGVGLDGSVVCSRLCFKSRALAEYAANQFKDIYKAFFN